MLGRRWELVVVVVVWVVVVVVVENKEWEEAHEARR